MIGLARSFGRYGYKRITGLLQMAGWNVNAKRVQRIWRREGLKVPARQPKRGRLWLSDGSCIRLRPEHRNHVWAYDFVAQKTHDGRPLKLLCVVDEYTRECLAIVVARRITSHEMLMTLADLFLEHGIPEHIRSDNGHEFQAKFHSHVEDQGIRHVYIKPRSPNLNGKVERSHLTDKLEFHQLLAYTDDFDLAEKLAAWEESYNVHRPHGGLGGLTPYEVLKEKMTS